MAIRTERKQCRRSRGIVQLALILVAAPGLAVGCSDTPREAAELTFRPSHELALLEAPGDLGAGGLVAARRGREFWALTAPGRQATEVYLFDAAGRFDRVIGSAGGGPREYAWISAIGFDAADSLWVFDAGNRRVDVYDRQWRFVRSMPLPGTARSVAPAPEGGLVVATVDRGSVDAAHRVERLRGTDRDLLMEVPAGNDPDDHVLVSAGAEAVFVARRREYAIWRIDGDEVRRLTGGAPDWWAEADAPEEVAGMVDTTPNLLSLASRGDAEIWVAGSVVRPPSTAATLFTGDHAPHEVQAELGTWIHNVVQVLDARTGETLREYRSTGHPVQLLVDELAYRRTPGTPEELLDWRIEIGRYVSD